MQCALEPGPFRGQGLEVHAKQGAPGPPGAHSPVYLFHPRGKPCSSHLLQPKPLREVVGEHGEEMSAPAQTYPTGTGLVTAAGPGPTRAAAFPQRPGLPAPGGAGPTIPAETGRAVCWDRRPQLWSQLYHQPATGPQQGYAGPHSPPLGGAIRCLQDPRAPLKPPLTKEKPSLPRPPPFLKRTLSWWTTSLQPVPSVLCRSCPPSLGGRHGQGVSSEDEGLQSSPDQPSHATATEPAQVPRIPRGWAEVNAPAAQPSPAPEDSGIEAGPRPPPSLRMHDTSFFNYFANTFTEFKIQKNKNGNIKCHNR